MRRMSSLVPILNAIFAPSLRSRRDVDGVFRRLLERACADMGEHALLDEADVDGYRRLLRGVAAAPGLTALGWAMARKDIDSLITNQLRVHALCNTHPSISNEVVERPIVIIGLPGTGTTVVHKFIAQSIGHRAPALWELTHTAPALPKEKHDRLIRQIDTTLALVTRLAPAMRSLPPRGADLPDGDLFVLPHGGRHLARAAMPEYEAWCYERDYARDYDYLKRVYQVLQHGREPARWVIESPTHLANLGQLMRVFPDARIVWFHRDPFAVIGSVCPLVETSQRLHVRRPDLHELGRMCLHQLSWMTRRAREARIGLPREQIIDVSYHRFSADPHAMITRLYDRLDAAWTAADQRRLDAALRQANRPTHEYDPARYGVTFEQVAAAFGDYIDIENAT